MAGRKRKHPKLHLVANTRPHYDASGQPTESPRAPEWLSKRACELFGALTARLEAMGSRRAPTRSSCRSWRCGWRKSSCATPISERTAPSMPSTS